ncbi:MAG TPA: hypothetical protein PKC89_12120 [Pyrinomonadaceae bacterium]|nr:hypothetical protein [Pyrinomonadaceae bacterium]
MQKIFGSVLTELDPVGAQRLACLLMAEIKLYESSKLERGLKANDIYTSLANEIERAREIFLGAHPQLGAAKIFNSAVVEILADGDVSKLGSGFPADAPS